MSAEPAAASPPTSRATTHVTEPKALLACGLFGLFLSLFQQTDIEGEGLQFLDENIE